MPSERRRVTSRHLIILTFSPLGVNQQDLQPPLLDLDLLPYSHLPILLLRVTKK